MINLKRIISACQTMVAILGFLSIMAGWPYAAIGILQIFTVFALQKLKKLAG